jgi:hypothetical protein
MAMSDSCGILMECIVIILNFLKNFGKTDSKPDFFRRDSSVMALMPASVANNYRGQPGEANSLSTSLQK